MATIGRYLPSGGDAGIATAAAGVMRGSRAAAPSTPMWVSHIGASIATQVGEPNGVFSYGCFAVNADGTPGALLGKTAEFSVSNEASGVSGLDWKEAEVLVPFLVYSDVIIAVLCEVADWVVGQDASGAIRYERTGQTSIPATWGSGTSTTAGTISAALIGETNVKPQAPDTTPDGVSTTDSTPEITVKFIDANEALDGHAIGTADKLRAVRIKVQQGGVLKWDYESETAVTSAHQAARLFSVEYAGTTLGGGTVEISAAVMDQAGVWSNWSEWDSFTLIQNIGAETLTPSGVITDDTPDITFRHTGSGAATHVQHRITSGNNVVFLGTKRSVSVAAGATGTTTAAQSGFPPIPKGWTYRLQTQTWIGSSASGWDPITNGNLFEVNAAPNKPLSLYPDNGYALTSRAELRFSVTDPDHASNLLTGEIELTTTGGVLIATRTATWDAAGYFKYQLTGSDIALDTTIRWRPRATDPLGAVGDWGDLRTIAYVTGPAPVITSPTAGQVIPTNTVTVSYTVTGQVRRQGFVYRADTGAEVYRTTDDTTSNQFFTVPSGYLKDQIGAYYTRVAVTNASNVTGFSPDVAFVIDVPAPAAATSFQASPALARFDPPSDPSVIDLTWDAVPGADHQLIWRRKQGQTFAQAILMERINSTLLRSWRDERPASGQTYIYSHQYAVVSGGDTVMSDLAEATATARFRTTIVQDVIDGDFERVVIRGWENKKVLPKDNRGFLTTWSGKPIQVGDALDYLVITEDWKIVTDPGSGSTAADLLEAAKSLRKLRDDLSPRVVFFRDPEPDSLFGVLELEWESDPVITFRVAATITETDYIEGVD